MDLQEVMVVGYTVEQMTVKHILQYCDSSAQPAELQSPKSSSPNSHMKQHF
jgi:hypothetical protein